MLFKATTFVVIRYSSNRKQIHSLKMDKRNIPNSFYKTNMVFISKPNKDILRKDNHSLISYINKHAKILNKLLTN